MTRLRFLTLTILAAGCATRPGRLSVPTSDSTFLASSVDSDSAVDTLRLTGSDVLLEATVMLDPRCPGIGDSARSDVLLTLRTANGRPFPPALGFWGTAFLWAENETSSVGVSPSPLESSPDQVQRFVFGNPGAWPYCSLSRAVVTVTDGRGHFWLLQTVGTPLALMQ
jgi:hypothetical protein